MEEEDEETFSSLYKNTHSYVITITRIANQTLSCRPYELSMDTKRRRCSYKSYIITPLQKKKKYPCRLGEKKKKSVTTTTTTRLFSLGQKGESASSVRPVSYWAAYHKKKVLFRDALVEREREYEKATEKEESAWFRKFSLRVVEIMAHIHTQDPF